MPNTAGLTSPHHAKHPLRDQLTEPLIAWLTAIAANPIIARTVEALLVVIIVIAALGTLTACDRTKPIPTITPVEQTTPTPAPAPSTTWEQVGA